MRDNIDFSYLVQGYISNTLSEEEKRLLLESLNDRENISKLSEMFAGWYNQAAQEGFDYDKEKVDGMIRDILANSSRSKLSAVITEPLSSKTIEDPAIENNAAGYNRNKIKLLSSSWFRYAAAAILFIGVGAAIYLNNRTTIKEPQVAQVKTGSKNDILPGSDKAVLTLSSGKKIELHASGDQIITDEGIAIHNNDGSLVYDKSDVVAYNTMTTPRGGQYKLQLPDGTIVWLNASSSITYPTAFPGNTRVVSITGEAYFEVAKNPRKPFTVKTYKDEITVKGTSFNVNSYTDEPGIKTSLLEGLVQINGMLLKPGNAYMEGKIAPTNLDRDLAWKNGVFNFNQVALKEAMKQIARWYDVELQYEGSVGDLLLGGEIGRNLTLQQVLSGLEDKDIHFRLEGKMLTMY